MVTSQMVNPFRRTILIGIILVNFNTYNMVFNGKAYFDEIQLLYFVNTIQAVALAYLVVNVFQELLVIEDKYMWSIKHKKYLNKPK